MTDKTGAPGEPWTWEEAEWRQRVDQVRAGRSLRPQSWPQGARCAVALSFDSDHETNELRDGGASIGRMSWGQYGSRVGVPRILERLKKAGIAATFFVPAVAALLYPDEQRRVIAEGHEIGLHGWIHELNSILPEKDERELHLRSSDTLTKITGVRPVGMRTPSWDFSPATLSIQREMGLLYDSSLMADDDAVYFNMNRFHALRPYTAPTAVLDIFRREFDAAWEEGGLFLLTMHPHVIGYRSRLFILDELIRHMQAKGGVWFATHRDVASHVRPAAPQGGPQSAPRLP